MEKEKKKEWEEWTKNILKKEGLSKWKLKSSKTQGDGLTMFGIKQIICTENHYALFLHEVAHAILGEPQTGKNNHGAIWGNLFTSLCKDYMTPK